METLKNKYTYDIENSFGDRLRDIRLIKKMKQEFVADYLNITQSSYSNYEVNKSEPNLKTLIKLAQLFEVSVSYFFGEKLPDENNMVNEPQSKYESKLEKQKEQMQEDFRQLMDLFKKTHDINHKS